jgi:hypothetical protein
MDELMLDGNAVAGPLQEVFAIEITTAVGTCANCGAVGPVGAVHGYRGAGRDERWRREGLACELPIPSPPSDRSSPFRSTSRLIPDVLIWATNAYSGAATAKTVLPLIAMHIATAAICFFVLPTLAAAGGQTRHPKRRA